MSKTKHKPYWEMTARELAVATKQFDREHAGTPGHALRAVDKAVHRRAARRGRPVVGAGSERINLTVERGLLKDADAFAKSRGLKRAQLVALALRSVLDSAGASKRTPSSAGGSRVARRKAS